MGSRIRKGKHRLFELFVEVRRSPDDVTNSAITFRYPAEFKDEELLKSIPEFAFPFAPDFLSSAVDHFTFVLTDIDSKFRFGFCRLSAQAECCLCIVSYFPWFEVFYRLLNYVAELQRDEVDHNIVLLLHSLADLDGTIPGRQLRSDMLERAQVFSFTIPDCSALPSIPDNRNLTEYYNAIDSYNMMIIFASMLFERRILVTSRKLSRLTACVHGAASLFYPFHWQHLYIPVLPPHLVDYCSAPMPYLIGVHSSLITKVTKAELGDAVILDADTNSLHCLYDDLDEMPPKVVALLKKDLRAHKKNKVATPCVLTGQTVSRAFLRSLVRLVGGYRSALMEHDGRLTFDPEVFVQSRSLSMQPFLERLLHLQAFEQFVVERIQLLQDNPDFVDDFESEIAESGVSDKQLSKSKNKVWPKYEKSFTGIASMVKSTGKSTIKTVKMTLNEFGADLGNLRRRNNDANVKIVVTPAGNDQTIVPGSINGGPTVLSAIRRESRHRPGSVLEANRRQSLCLSTEDGDVFDRLLQQATLPLLSEGDMEKMFRKYSVDNLLDSVTSLSGESDYSRDNLSIGADNLSMELDSLRFFEKREARSIRQSSSELNMFQGKYVSCSTPNMAECLDYPGLQKSRDNKAAVSEVKVEITRDGEVVNQPSCHLTTFSSQEIAQQKSDLISALSRSSENSKLSQNLDSSTNVLQQSARMRDKTDDQSDFHNRRKYRLSVKYLPNVQQIIQRYEKTAEIAPPSVSSTTKHSIRPQASESTESLVARQAAHYMKLDRNAHLEIHFEHHQGSNGKLCDSRKEMGQCEHSVLRNCSSNSSTASSTSVSLGGPDVLASDSTCDLQSNSSHA